MADATEGGTTMLATVATQPQANASEGFPIVQNGHHAPILQRTAAPSNEVPSVAIVTASSTHRSGDRRGHLGEDDGGLDIDMELDSEGEDMDDMEDDGDPTMKDFGEDRIDGAAFNKPSRRRKRGPRAALSAFSFYQLDVLDEVCAQQVDTSPEKIVDIVEQRWNNLGEEDKLLYNQRAVDDEQRYQEEIKLYLPKSQGGKMKRKKAKKHPNAPKHPMSAYLYFVADNRQKLKDEFPNHGFTEIAKMLGEQWRALDPTVRGEYERRAAMDKERYKSEKLTFQPVPVDDVKEPVRKKKHPLAPKHPLSAYLYFVATNRPKMNAEHPDKDFTEVAQMLGQIWKNMSRQERKKYDILAFADKKRYLAEKARWSPPLDSVKKEPTSGKRKQEMAPLLSRERDRDVINSRGLAVGHGMMGHPQSPRSARAASSMAMAKPAFDPYWGDPMRMMAVDHDPRHPLDRREMMPAMYMEMKEDHDYPDEVRRGKRYRSDSPDLFSGAPKKKVRQKQSTGSAEVLSWSAHDIGRFIASLGLSEHKDTFVRSGITGEHFVKLSSPQLRDNFGVANIGDRKRIIKGIASLVALIK